MKISEQKAKLLFGSLGIMFVNRSYGQTTSTTVTLDALMKALQVVADHPEIIAEETNKK